MDLASSLISQPKPQCLMSLRCHVQHPQPGQGDAVAEHRSDKSDQVFLIEKRDASERIGFRRITRLTYMPTG